jgi:hypothetical protein
MLTSSQTSTHETGYTQTILARPLNRKCEKRTQNKWSWRWETIAHINNLRVSSIRNACEICSTEGRNITERAAHENKTLSRAPRTLRRKTMSAYIFMRIPHRTQHPSGRNIYPATVAQSDRDALARRAVLTYCAIWPRARAPIINYPDRLHVPAMASLHQLQSLGWANYGRGSSSRLVAQRPHTKRVIWIAITGGVKNFQLLYPCRRGIWV